MVAPKSEEACGAGPAIDEAMPVKRNASDTTDARAIMWVPDSLQQQYRDSISWQFAVDSCPSALSTANRQLLATANYWNPTPRLTVSRPHGSPTPQRPQTRQV